MQQVGGVFDLPHDLVPGRYRLTGLLGRGGMGEVYLGTDLRLKRDVAIKLLSPDKATDAEARWRLMHEAQAAATLDHPHICPVYDTGESPDGLAYIVMQYVEGQTLSQILQQRQVSAEEALQLTTHVASALSAAHQRGLIHRDVKPANVIVTPSGQTKLLDLGIAKLVTFPAPLGDADTASAVTSEGTFIGTPPYMSPEQIQQRPLDGRSDLFSLGTVLYECLTGRQAFSGATHIETMANVLHKMPPPPSAAKPSVGARYDALCAKLLAKQPDERYQSGQDVIDAIRELSPRGGILGLQVQRRTAVLIAVAAIALTAFLGWTLLRPATLPEVPPESARWYVRGTEAIREGAYITGRTALEQAIAVFPGNVLAYARLAEADAQLDDERSAQQRLVQLADVMGNEAALPPLERIRLRAVRALVLRDLDASEAAYAEIVAARPQEAAAWLDLGRAQESIGRLADARKSYEEAVTRDTQYAPAHLRLGYAFAQEGSRDRATAAFAEAERLYRAASDDEGETEVLIRRGMVLDQLGELKPARVDLERALLLATNAGRIHQQVRARSALSSVTASEGRFAEAAALASAAVDEASRHGLETVAANGLVDLASILQTDRPDEAAAQLDRALELANRRGARRTIARVRLQQASLMNETNRPREALALVDEVLPFVRGRYRRYELIARSVAARAHQQLGDLEQARRLSAETLEIAKAIQDEAQQATAAGGLALVAATLGELPEAIAARAQAIDIRRRQGDHYSLPYDLASQADQLIRLGRQDEAAKLLDELDAGAAARLHEYVGRRLRVAFLRGLSATTLLRCDDALRSFERVATLPSSKESAAVLAPVVASFCRAVVGKGRAAPAAAPADVSAALGREAAYWLAVAALERQDAGAALSAATQGLRLLGTDRNPELLWRLSAVVAAAAGQDRQQAGSAAERARGALQELRARWKDDITAYERRPDLMALQKRAGLQ